MTPELIATLCDHAQGNLRALMNMAGELLALAAQREVPQIDEKLFFEAFRRARADAAQSRGGTAAMKPPDGTCPSSRPIVCRSAPRTQRWLVTGLWSEEAVGIVGGEPKCCKSFLALDLAVAVASGTACLRHFPVPHRRARAALRRRGCSAHRAPAARRHLCRRRRAVCRISMFT